MKLLRTGSHPFVAAFVSVAAAGFAFGIVLPVTSVILEELDTATPLTGLMATAMFAGIALGAPLVGRCIELNGLRTTITGGLLAAGLTMAALALGIHVPAWFALRFCMGVAFSAVFTSCETLINRFSTERNRGRNLGLYGFAFSLALMAGPAGLWLLQFGAWVPFLLTGCVLLAAAALAGMTVPSAQEQTPDLKFNLGFLKRLRVSLAAMAMCGFMEGALLALIPIFSLRVGFSELQTGLLLFGFMLGHGGLTPVIGIVGDRIGLRRVLVLTYLLGTAAFFCIICLPVTMWLLVPLVLAGASVGALYPLGVGLLGELLSSDELPRGNAMTTFCYGAGSVAGPFLPALLMHFTAPGSLFYLAAALYVTVLVCMLKQ